MQMLLVSKFGKNEFQTIQDKPSLMRDELITPKGSVGELINLNDQNSNSRMKSVPRNNSNPSDKLNNLVTKKIIKPNEKKKVSKNPRQNQSQKQIVLQKE